MEILYAASEANPFAKSRRSGRCGRCLAQSTGQGRRGRPRHHAPVRRFEVRDKLEYVTNYSVPVGWRSQYCGLFKADVDGVAYYFMDNEYYFKRSGLYGFYDDGERYAFFARAMLETLFYTDFEPRYHQLQRLADRADPGVPEPVLSPSG